MIPTEFAPVNSSMMNGAAYEAATQQLYIRFSDGSVWEYDEVPQEDYDGLFSGSAGAFFHQQIKNVYDGRRV